MASESGVSFNRNPEASNDREANVYDDGYLRIEYDNYYVACGGRRVPLPLKEFLIVSRLARNTDRIVPFEEIWRYAWGDAPFNPESLRVHVHRLRRILNSFGLRVKSLVGVGYSLSLGHLAGEGGSIRSST